ncbi:MAG: transcription termination/antitermination protein NusA [Deltaproteobacteria bacterium]|nr:transcription termination/antitermination protein NusA [Deltaproteobacteria bacterium]
MGFNLNNIIEQVGKDKGIDKAVLIEALESAMLTAARKKYGPYKEIEARYNEELGEIELFIFKTVVEDITDHNLQISLEEAKGLDPEVAVGDSLGIKLNTSEFGRIAAQTAKQIIIQKVRDAERDIIYNENIGKVGEVVTGIVQRFEKGDIIVNLSKAEAILPRREQVRREGYRQGDRVRALILEVKRESKGPQIILSRTRPNLLVKLFKAEVPEIYEGIVGIKGVAREPGDRAKIGVASTDSDVDPVGACVGVKGSRVQAVVQELRGERIDIVPWSEDPVHFVCNALSPAQVFKVIEDEASHSMEVIVPDEQLSLAIGKKGQNVRLAAKLTGWKISIHSESEARGISREEEATTEGALPEREEEVPASEEVVSQGVDRTADGVDVLPGIGPKTALLLREAGFSKVGDIVKASVEDLSRVEGIGQKKAENFLKAAQEYVGEVQVKSQISKIKMTD